VIVRRSVASPTLSIENDEEVQVATASAGVVAPASASPAPTTEATPELITLRGTPRVELTSFRCNGTVSKLPFDEPL